MLLSFHGTWLSLTSSIQTAARVGMDKEAAFGQERHILGSIGLVPCSQLGPVLGC